MPALIFDCDGVLADTERYGHLPAFNETFAAFGIPVRWSDADYAREGADRRRQGADGVAADAGVRRRQRPADRCRRTQRAMLAQWHRHKTAAYTAMVAAGAMPARPGIARIVDEAAAAGWQLAVASTSAEPSVRAVLEHAVGRGPGRATSRCSPVTSCRPRNPTRRSTCWPCDHLASSRTRPSSSRTARNGLRAALGAGLACVVTVSTYTADEDFTGAALVV